MNYDSDIDTVQVGFLPTAIRTIVDRAMTSGIEAIETKLKWSQVDLIDRIEFGQSLGGLMLNWNHGRLTTDQYDFIVLYGGNMTDQAERAILPAMDAVIGRPDYFELLDRFPLLGALGSPFGAPMRAPSNTVPSREQADEMWSM